MREKLREYFVLLPILYVVTAVFAARSKVQLVYLASLVLLVAVVAIQYRQKLKPLELLAQWMIVLAAIGISASVILSIEKVELLAEPTRIASCSLSPVVACSPVIMSPQASALGLPNSYIGIFGFTAVFTAGMTLLAGGIKLSKQWWQTLLGGIALGAIFSSWLIYQGVFNIGKLCLYCLLVWLVTFALLWLVAGYATENKYVNLGARLKKLLSYRYELIATTYAIILMIILYRWSDYWFGSL